MDSGTSKVESKSLRKRGKQILSAPFKGLSARLSSRSGDHNSQSSSVLPMSPNLSSFGGSSRSGEIPGQTLPETQSSDDTQEFLGRSLDPSWIDIEMMGYWLQKCDTEHGEACRRPFGLDPAGLGSANLLIDIRMKCLAVAKPGDRYACLSYVCKYLFL